MPKVQSHHHKNHNDNVMHISIIKSLKHRIPWLFIGLIGGVLSAKIIEGFEITLEKNIILAAFIPLIVYMADAVGTQMESFIIRDIALHPKIKFGRYFYRQILITIVIGLLLGTVLFISGSILYKSPQISFVIALSLFFAVVSSVLTGLLIPYFIEKTDIDPANVSGPIATIIQDIISVTIYFIIAANLL